jgi:ankyrin repeat protein
VPLHNACSYGHFEVTELLINHGAHVNAMDLWQFTPLHEVSHNDMQKVACSVSDPYLLDPDPYSGVLSNPDPHPACC